MFQPFLFYWQDLSPISFVAKFREIWTKYELLGLRHDEVLTRVGAVRVIAHMLLGIHASNREEGLIKYHVLRSEVPCVPSMASKTQNYSGLG